MEAIRFTGKIPTMTDDLEKIIKYRMDKMEAKAYKLALMWEKYCEKEFPNERHTKLKKTGDPRDSNLFKYCYKLARETNGLIQDDEYYLYIIAQLQILKTMRSGDVHALIEPQILVGDKAWRRWKLWKKYYDKKMSEVKCVEDIGITESESKINSLLQNTKEFFDKKSLISYEKVKEKLDDLSMIRWITTGNVTPYYAILSPWVNRWLAGRSLEEVFKFDLSVYRPSVSTTLETSFRNIFSREFV